MIIVIVVVVVCAGIYFWADSLSCPCHPKKKKPEVLRVAEAYFLDESGKKPE